MPEPLSEVLRLLKRGRGDPSGWTLWAQRVLDQMREAIGPELVLSTSG